MDFYQINANPIFGIHNPVGLRLLTRLLGLSHLREHKFNHRFIDCENPYCPCDSMSVESVDFAALIMLAAGIHFSRICFRIGY